MKQTIEQIKYNELQKKLLSTKRNNNLKKETLAEKDLLTFREL